MHVHVCHSPGTSARETKLPIAPGAGGRAAAQAGFAVPILLLLIMGLLLLAGGAIQVTSGRHAVATEGLAQERAFQAAEAGLDEACFRANTAALVAGTSVVGSIGRGQAYTFTTADMRTDGVDNDLDGTVDEADEKGFVVTALGTYLTARRRLAVRLVQLAELPLIDAVVTCTDPLGSISASGRSFTMKGDDLDPDGSPGTGDAIRGAAVASPATTASLLSALTGGQQARITGKGGTPSAIVTPPFDLSAVADSLRPVAQNLLAPGTYGAAINNFGSPSTDQWRITWCPGSLNLNGGAHGAGILIVDGNLNMAGNCSFMGLVLVKGNLSINGGAAGSKLWGAVMVDGNVSLSGGVDFQYSSLVMSKVSTILRRYYPIGWREVAR